MNRAQLVCVFSGCIIGTLLLVAAFAFSFEPVHFSGSIVVSDGARCSPKDSVAGRFLIAFAVFTCLVTFLVTFLLRTKKSVPRT